MDDFEKGYNFAIEHSDGLYAADFGAGYVRNVEDAISELYRRMNAYDYYKATEPAQESLKGFLAEEFAAGTANIDAALKGSSQRFYVPQSRGLGSVDVAERGGDALYQLKFYKSPYQTVRALGTTLFDRYHGLKAAATMDFDTWAASVGRSGANRFDLLYEGQLGLVAEDKLEACRDEAFRLLARSKDLGNEEEIVRWQKVSDALVDRVRGEKGVKGRPLRLADARQKAIDVSNGKTLDSADDGIAVSDVIQVQNILRQSLRAGATAAAVSAALKVAPEIYRAIDLLISDGKLDKDSIRAIGAATLDGSATGFVNGTATAAVTALACKGAFGSMIKAAVSKTLGPTVIGTLVVMTIEACKNAYLFARGEKTQQDFANSIFQGAFTSVVVLVGAGIATLVSGGAALPVLIGSIVGSAAGSLAFSPAKSCVLKLASTTGFSFFGLVQQDYELPDSTAYSLGLKRAVLKRPKVATFVPEQVQTHNPKVKRANVHTINIAYNNRGIIEINKVGYLP